MYIRLNARHHNTVPTEDCYISQASKNFTNLPTWLLGAPAMIKFNVLEAISALVGLMSTSPLTMPTRTAPVNTSKLYLNRKTII